MSLFIPGVDTLFESGLDNLIQHMRTNSVVAGCDVVAHAAPDMGVRVNAGSIQGLGLVVTVAQTDLVVAVSGANPRLDLVHVDMTTGVPAIITGTPAAVPKPPALPANSIELGLVGVGIGAINIQTANIANRRLIAQSGAKFQGFISIGTNAATASAIRIPNAANISARNFANTANFALMGLGADDIIAVDSNGAGVRFFSPFIAMGASAAAAGTIRLANAQQIAFRNSAGTGDSRFAYGISVTDTYDWTISNTLIASLGSTYFAVGVGPASAGAIRLNNTASSSISWRNNAGADNNEIRHNAVVVDAFSFMQAGVEVVQVGAGYIGIGTTRASAGTIRLPNSGGLNWRNAANTLNWGISLDAGDNMSFTIPAGKSFYPTVDNSFDLGVGGLTWRNVHVGTFVAIGSTPATAYSIRLPNNSFIGWRNAANSANLGFGVDSGNNWYWDNGSGLTMQLLAASGQLNVINTLAVGTNPATAGIIRIPNAQSIIARNGANTANISPLIGTDASNRILIGDNTNGDDIVLTPLSTKQVDFNYAQVALGGGAGAGLGTIGGSGPAAAGQNSWLRVKVAGNIRFIPLWA